MDIALLADHPELIPELAGWFHREWPEASANYDSAERLRQFSVRDTIPMSFVALEQASPIGTASLLSESVHSHRHLSPWVGGLYVIPERRHQGVATQLISVAVRAAASLGESIVYMGISAAGDFYERTGWIYEAQGRAGDDEVMIFSMTSPGPPR
jgi:predicted N-acetyltransferase YhbS